MASVDEGYEDQRFETTVPNNFHCAICLNVLKQPMQCRENEHSFCNPCIVRYLQEYERCPSCMERLTLQTLRPSRVITDLVSQLKIKCDNVERGCPDIMKLESLEAHVQDCGFGPVKCTNNGCEVIIHRKDQLNHENDECNYRKAKCEVCGKDVPLAKRTLHCYVTKTEMNQVKEEVSDMKEIVLMLSRDLTHHMGEITVQMGEMKDRMGAMGDQVGEMKDQIGEMKDQVGEMKDQMGEMKDQMGTMGDQVGEMKDQMGEMKDQMGTMGDQVGEMKDQMGEMKDQIGEMKDQIGTTRDQKSEMRDQVGNVLKLEVLKVEHLKQPPQSPTHPLDSPVTCSAQNVDFRNDIIIAGGQDLRSVEVFSKTTRQWTHLPLMTSVRCCSSSFVHQHQLFLCGGQGSDSVEVLQLRGKDAQWKKFPAKLPWSMYGRTSTVVYGDNVFTFGGNSNDIYKVSLVAPYSSQLVSHMPEERTGHGVQRFGDKVAVVGGSTAIFTSGSLDSVLVYDITNNCCQTLAPLPFPVFAMATVAWKDNIILIGGLDENFQTLNTVVSYNIKEEKSKMLPSMKHERSLCTAVVTGDVIVVMGGQNEIGNVLKSAECFTIGDEEWTDLPPMKERRCGSTAVVKM